MSPVQASRFANHRSAGEVLRRLHHVLPVVALCLAGAMTPAAAQSFAPTGDQQPASTSAPTVTNGQAVQPSSAEPQAAQQPATPVTSGTSTSVPAAPVSASPGSAPATAPVATPAENASGNEAAQAPQSVSPVVQQSGQASEQNAGQPVTPLAGPQEADLPPLPAMTPPETGGLHDLSPWGMFMQADIVVKAVMIGLALASLATWTVWLAKSLELSFARRRVRRGLDVLRRANTLNEAESGLRVGQRGRGTVFTLVEGALDEAKRSGDLPADGVKERAAILLTRIEGRAGRRMMIGTGILASIGSTSPFIGLFGTVWGIMNSFIGIAESNTTNLAVVAPGIAEALLATAIGLVAAIPAVIIYNIFARSISGYKALLGDASAEILRHLSRDLDRRAQSREQPAHRLATGQVSSLRSAAE